MYLVPECNTFRHRFSYLSPGLSFPLLHSSTLILSISPSLSLSLYLSMFCIYISVALPVSEVIIHFSVPGLVSVSVVLHCIRFLNTFPSAASCVFILFCSHWMCCSLPLLGFQQMQRPGFTMMCSIHSNLFPRIPSNPMQPTKHFNRVSIARSRLKAQWLPRLSCGDAVTW